MISKKVWEEEFRCGFSDFCIRFKKLAIDLHRKGAKNAKGGAFITFAEDECQSLRSPVFGMAPIFSSPKATDSIRLKICVYLCKSASPKIMEEAFKESNPGPSPSL